MGENSYTITQLNDFTVQDTSFTDDTAANRYYVYAVQAIKSGGSPGSLTTTAAVFVSQRSRSLVIWFDKTARLDGNRVALPVQPEIKSGRMMIPTAALDLTGVKASYEASSGKVTLVRRLENVTYTINMGLNSPDYTWNGTSYKTDVLPYLSEGEVMVPLRCVAPMLGLGISFDSGVRSATIVWMSKCFCVALDTGCRYGIEPDGSIPIFLAVCFT